jgi:hypothetical protein
MHHEPQQSRRRPGRSGASRGPAAAGAGHVREGGPRQRHHRARSISAARRPKRRPSPWDRSRTSSISPATACWTSVFRSTPPWS